MPAQAARRLPHRPRRAVARRAAPPARRAGVALHTSGRPRPELTVRLIYSGARDHHRILDRRRDVREDRRTVPTDEGDHERFSHYVDKDKLTEAMVMGTPVVALCGKVWVPEPGAGEVPGLPGVQGDLGDHEAGDSATRGLRRVTGRPARRSRSTPRTRLRPGRSARPGARPRRCAPGRRRRWTQYFARRAARLPRGRDAGRRQDDVRAVGRRRAARAPRRRPDHGRGADRAPQAAVGRGGRPGRHPDRPDVLRGQGQDLAGLRRHRGDLRRRRGEPAGDADPHRALQDAGDPRRGAPRR